jgi:RNA polymerase sigma factor (sigma-70 family)
MDMNTDTIDWADLSDEQLCRRSCGGDREAFAQIVTRYESLIASLAYAACGNLTSAEDLAQETFVAAWRGLAGLRDPARMRPWLCGIVRNLAASAARRDFRAGAPAVSLEAVREPTADDSDPAFQAVSREEAALLWRSLESLPMIYRESLVLFYRQGQSIADVALALDISEDAVRQRLTRGRAMLRDDLADRVESTLARARTSAGFTLAVLAALPALAPASASAATAAKGANTAVATVVASKGLGMLKSWLLSVNFWPILGPVIGLAIGWFSSQAAVSLGRSGEERALLRRHARHMVCFAWLMSIGLVIVLLGAGRWYQPRPWPIILGVLGWTATLVGTIWWLSERIDRRARAIRATSQTLGADASQDRLSGLARLICLASWDYVSGYRFLGLPLLAVVGGSKNDPQQEGAQRSRVAVGWLACGDVAVSPLFAIGGLAIAPVTLGAVTVGLFSFSLWGVALGGLAIGSIAIGWWAFGMVAIGGEAAAGMAVVAGRYAWGAVAGAPQVNSPAVREWFESQWFFVPAVVYAATAHWLILLIIVIALLAVWYRSRRRRTPLTD